MAESITVYLNTDRRGPAGPAGSGGGGAWGEITGTLADQTDLQSALDAKLASATVTAAWLRTQLGIPEYSSLAAANAALTLGTVFYNTTNTAYEVATA